MEKSPCVIPLQPNSENTEVEELRSTYIPNCVFNSFLSYTAIMLNIVTIHAIRRTLLLSLAVSDVGVGLLGQPFYVSLVVEWLHQNNPACITNIVFIFIVNAFSLASFFGVVAISVDRFLAIHLHLRYQELVTPRRVADVVISTWLLSVAFPVVVAWLLPDLYSLLTFFLGILGLVVTTLVNIRIYLTARRHKNQIRGLQLQGVRDNSEMSRFARLVKSAVGILYVYLLFLICYLPFLICLVANEINGPSVPLKSWFIFSLTLIFLSSSLNPVIYCWKMRHIRHAIMAILRNTPWLRNRVSHTS